MTNSQPQGFLAVPPTGKGPGVLVLHAWWGLNDTIKAFCKRLTELDTGSLSLTLRRHTTRQPRAWHGIEPWLS
jgi:hypothetical protein